MNYRVQHYSHAGIAYLTLESLKSGEYAILLPGYGGTVHQIALSSGNIPPQEILQSDRPDEIPLNPWFRGRILFPFDDRIHAGRYCFEGKEYQLPINDPDGEDALHGFLYAQPLRVALSESNQQMAMAVLEGEIVDQPGYPFRLHIRLVYSLDADGFHIELHIKNTGSASAPFSVGWHPYFRPAGSDVSHTRLLILAERYVEMDAKLVPSGRLRPVHGSEIDFRRTKQIGSLDLDHGFENTDGYMECSSADLCIRIEQSDLFSYSQVFVPPDRKSVAMEPISAATDAFNKPELGLRILAPGAEATGRISVSVR